MANNNRSLDQWLKRLETQHNKKIDLGLSRVKQVYNNLNLDKIAETIITVAGTNGKGSTVAMLSSVCREAYYKVGEFTSPHLLKFNERIKVNNSNVSDIQITNAFKHIEQNLNGISLSYFEYATLAACIIFKQENVDIAILEVGLGGRLDSVNAIDTDCAIITTIDIDHTNWLGDDIESIAFEKAGIMRAGKPVIYGDKNCPQSIIKRAQELDAQLYCAGVNPQPYLLNLNGAYQQLNAATVITALETLDDKLNISKKAIQNGLKNISLQARLQLISEKPAVYLDVAHNSQAATSLSKWLVENPIKGKTIAVFAVLEDKKVKDWLCQFFTIFDIWCISQADTQRAMAHQDLLTVLVESSQLITSFANIKAAFKGAHAMASQEDRIIVFGSFYTVSAVMQQCE